MNDPGVSVVVCTMDRPASLARALESLAGQAHGSFEVLVVDQSRTEATRALVEDRARADPRFRYLRLDRAGLSRAYNAAVASTAGGLLAFTDDDCTAPAGWLGAVEGAFRREPDAGLLYGQVLLPPDDEGREERDGFTPMQVYPERRVLSRERGWAPLGMGANFAARRRLFELVGPFDELLGAGSPLESAQDLDLSYRTCMAGVVTLLEPDVVIHHYGRRSHDGWPALIRSYGVGHGGFYLKHVRIGDPYATRRLLAHLAALGRDSLARSLGRTSRRHPKAARAGGAFGEGMMTGMRRSLRLGVDRRRRLYRPPGAEVR